MSFNIDYIVHIACLMRDPVHTLREHCMLTLYCWQGYEISMLLISVNQEILT